MPGKEGPRVMMLLSEVDMLVKNLDDKLTHVLLPPFPPSDPKASVEAIESDVTRQLRNIISRFNQLNDRVET